MTELSPQAIKPEWRLTSGAIILRMARVAPPAREVHIRASRVRPDANAHVRAYYSLRAQEENLTVLQFIRLQSKAEGINYEILISTTHLQVYYAHRRAVLSKTAERFPSLSSAQLGRIFNRHHTSILYALGRTATAKKRAAGA